MASMILSGGKKPKAGSMTDIENSEPTKLPTIEPTANTTKTPNNPLQPKAMDLPIGNEADMQKVRDYQTKLNAKGAGLKVDGIWGDKTAAASRDYYNKYQKGKIDTVPKPSTSTVSTTKNTTQSPMKLSKGDSEFKSVSTPAAESYFKDKNKKKEAFTKNADGTMTANFGEGIIHTLTGKETRQELIAKNKAMNLTLEPDKKTNVEKPVKDTGLSTFLNTQGQKSVSIEQRKKNIITENNRVMKLSNTLKKEKNSNDDLDNQIKKARENGDTKTFNNLVNKKSKMRLK